MRDNAYLLILLVVFSYGCSDTVDSTCENGVCVGDLGQSDARHDSDMRDVSTDVSDAQSSDVGTDLSNADGGTVDSGSDAGNDSNATDSGDAETDAANDAETTDTANDAETDVGNDAEPNDVGNDAAPNDVGNDANLDSGTADSGSDASDTGVDAGPMVGDCISGATGTHAVRFKWRGNGPGSTAYVGYETNQLPDTSRWQVGAYGRSFSYTPKFNDTFLGIGGLELTSSNFIDVKLSTAGITQVRNATIAVFGRSYNTTASGSYSWMSFDGSGASPYGQVANSAPYQWYQADATSAFAPGNAGILLRIEAEGPSNSLIVNSVEICFDAS